jgi:myosin-5
MELGAGVWVPHPKEAWVAGQVTGKESDGSTDTIVVTVDGSGEQKPFTVPAGASEADDIKLRNVGDGDGVGNNADISDLINLPYLHEPAILHSLSERYKKGSIYTNTGPILIALNPFKRLPLYTNEVLQEYYNIGLLASQVHLL